MPPRWKTLLSRTTHESATHEIESPSQSTLRDSVIGSPSGGPSPRAAILASADANDAFTAMWRDALDDFDDVTGENISSGNSDLYKQLQACSDYASIVKILDGKALEFKAYRRGSTNAMKMRAALRPVVCAIINMIDIGAEAAASKAVPGGKAVFVAIAVLFKTVQGVSARFDALVSLFEKFDSFLERLDVRLNAPFESASRALAVKTLAKMVRTLAYATQMMRQNRFKHFFSVLIGLGGDIADITERTENLMIEETRLSLAEIHIRMHGLSEAFMSTLHHVENGMDLLNERIDAVSLGVTGVSDRLHGSGLYDMPHRLDAFIERYEEDRSDDGPNRVVERSMTTFRNKMTVQTTIISSRLGRVESALESLGKDLARPSPAVSQWSSRISLPCADLVSFSRMASEILSCFRDMSPEEQATLRQGIIALYAVTTASVVAGSRDRSTDVLLKGILNPTTMLSGFLPLILAYLAVFVFWKRFVCRVQVGIPNGPGFALGDSIIFIDVSGTHYVLRPERLRTWEALHDFLLDQYEDREGIEFIRSHAYRIMDTNGDESVIKRQNWGSVREGMTLELSFAVRQKRPSCLWCGEYAVAHTRVGWVQCSQCGRRFWVSKDYENGISEPARTIEQPRLARASSSKRRVVSQSTSDPHLAVPSYRRVAIVYTKEKSLSTGSYDGDDKTMADDSEMDSADAGSDLESTDNDLDDDRSPEDAGFDLFEHPVSDYEKPFAGIFNMDFEDHGPNVSGEEGDVHPDSRDSTSPTNHAKILASPFYPAPEPEIRAFLATQHADTVITHTFGIAVSVDRAWQLCFSLAQGNSDLSSHVSIREYIYGSYGRASRFTFGAPAMSPFVNFYYNEEAYQDPPFTREHCVEIQYCPADEFPSCREWSSWRPNYTSLDIWHYVSAYVQSLSLDMRAQDGGRIIKQHYMEGPEHLISDVLPFFFNQLGSGIGLDSKVELVGNYSYAPVSDRLALPSLRVFMQFIGYPSFEASIQTFPPTSFFPITVQDFARQVVDIVRAYVQSLESSVLSLSHPRGVKWRFGTAPGTVGVQDVELLGLIFVSRDTVMPLLQVRPDYSLSPLLSKDEPMVV
ncbi:unnamed protein product [Peniophora sp. CBMAI 1063]|nr:unnamed protein product [Peniophora sp. CBMAI 1063]